MAHTDSRSGGLDPEAELDWWRHFRLRFRPGYGYEPPPVGTPLGSVQFRLQVKTPSGRWVSWETYETRRDLESDALRE